MVADLKVLKIATAKTGSLIPKLEEELITLVDPIWTDHWTFCHTLRKNHKDFSPWSLPCQHGQCRGVTMSYCITPALFSNKTMTEIVQPS